MKTLLKIQSKTFPTKLVINAFEHKTEKLFSKRNAVSKTECNIEINVTPVQSVSINIVDTYVTGIDFAIFDRYNNFIKNNAKEIITRIKSMYSNFNSKNNCNVVPKQGAIIRILDGLERINADSMDIFSGTTLTDFYPEIYTLESKAVNKT